MSRVVHMPDLNGFHMELRRQLGVALIDCGRKVIKQNEEYIQARKRLDGSAQRENAPNTKADKRRRLGHDIPLRDKDILVTPDRHLINGVQATKARIKPPENLRVVVSPAPKRRKIIGYLRLKGYEPPWGLNDDTLRFIRRRLKVAVQQTRTWWSARGGAA